jgi:imidazolonepropionase-like amidohydrolase
MRAMPLFFAVLLTGSGAAFALDAEDGKFVAYQQPLLVFTHAEVIDGTGAAPLFDQTMVVRDGRIVALGDAGKVPVPAGATIIEARGRTLLPGFVMVHEHLFYTMGRTYTTMPYTFPRLYLAGGTTTARTAGSMTPYEDINLKHQIAAGDIPGPDLDVTGPYLNGPSPYAEMHALTGPDDATRTVNFWADQGATSFKAYTDITRAELKAAIDAAHARGFKITAHLCSVTFREAAEMGIDNLEHAFEVATDFVHDKKPDACPPRSQISLATVDVHGPEAKALIDLLVVHHVALTSTLTVLETFAPGRPQAPARALDMLIPELRKYYLDNWADTQKSERMKPYAAVFANLLQMEKMFVEAGGTLLVGTDSTGYGGVIPGFSGKREIELLVEAGFTFPQALRMATLNGATFLGRDREVGSLVLGKRADIAVVDGDPMKYPAAIEAMKLVFKNGVGYRSEAIFDAMKGKVGLY